MPVPFKPIRAIFAKNVLNEEGFIIEKEGGVFRVTSGKVYTDLKPDEDHLNYCFAVFIQSSAVLRTGPINTLNKAREFLAFAKDRNKILAAQFQQMHRKPRIVCEQLNDPLLDWDKIRLQNVYLKMAAHEEKLGVSVAHMCLPTGKLFVKSDVEPRTPFQNRNADKLAKELNWYGWVQYALWIAEEMDTLLENIRSDASQKYQIVGLFQEFVNESRSVLLRKCLQEIQELSLKYGELELKRIAYPLETTKIKQDILAIEKDIFKTSLEVKEALKGILALVLKIEAEAVREKNIREEYVPMRRIILLYRKLLQTQIEPTSNVNTSWIQQGMLRQLLDDELNVVSAVNCSNGIEQTHLTFSLKIATLELKQKYPAERVVDVAFNWDTSVLKVNAVIQKNGYEAYRTWILHPPVEQEEVAIHRRAGVIDRLRKLFFRILMDMCLPIQQITGVRSSGLEANIHADKSYLNILPSFLEMKYEDGDVESIPYVSYNETTGEPIDLLEKGYRTLSRFRY